MERFDCLAAETPLFGPHFLEASAGTGKTFAIEHIVARLILEGVDLEQILVVTFTRAAARELKLRIRSNLERICAGALWAYLPKNCKPIAEALASFDRCQIFTIHGFCSRMLKEYAFEAGLQLGFREAKDPGVDIALKDFFELKLTQSMVSVQQLDRLVRSAGSVKELARKLKKGEKPESASLYVDREQAFCQKLSQCPYPLDHLLEEFEQIQGNYKKMAGDFFGQIAALQKKDFGSLLAEKESIFSYTAAENKKVKVKDLPTPLFFDWGRAHLLPLIESAQDPKEILNTMLFIWKPIQEKVLRESGFLGPDELIQEMSEAIKNDLFRGKVQGKFRAVLIDEFQDTDPVQWALFETLFLKTTEAFYLIGDPKQSIYRFRKADLYTYLKAKEAIPAAGHFHLDTNFRSSKPLIEALNGLFDRQWLYLPKEKRSLPYLPVRSGLELMADFGDEKGAVHCVRLEKEESYLYAASEMIRLKEKVASWGSFAVLVKDRYQSAEMQSVLAELNIPSIARSQEPLCESVCYSAVKELFAALRKPRDLGAAKAVLAGPFGGFSAAQIQGITLSPFVDLRAKLEEKGVAVACQIFANTKFGDRTVQENIAAQGALFIAEWNQLLELIFEWEQSCGFSFEGLGRFFDRIEQLDPDEAICRRKESDADAVQIMTMHVSKGLEFDIVFALGLGTRTPEGDEEAESEKLRQLYVAMTRAKRRLYVPIPLESKEAKLGTFSPIELFCRALSPEGLWEAELQRLSTTTSLTIEYLQEPVVLQPVAKPERLLSAERIVKIPPFQPSYLLSFTSIAQEMSLEALAPMPEVNGIYTVQNFPRGAETGVIIHRMFERIFSEQTPLAEIVEQEIGIYSLWKKAVRAMIQECLDLPFSFGFSLNDVDRSTTRVEVEFLFSSKHNYVKGFIDLLFVYGGKLYFLDWKTNWLTDYSPENLEAAISAHQYDLQASIYTEALKREWAGEIGGAIYLFVRGPQACCFQGKAYD